MGETRARNPQADARSWHRANPNFERY